MQLLHVVLKTHARMEGHKYRYRYSSFGVVSTDCDTYRIYLHIPTKDPCKSHGIVTSITEYARHESFTNY